MENCVEFHLKTKFVDEPKENGLVKQYKKDPTIKKYIATDAAIRAFTNILFDSYSTTEAEKPQQIIDIQKGNQTESDMDLFEELYNFSNNPDDYITVKQFRRILKMSKLTTSNKLAMIWLENKGITQTIMEIDNKNTRVYQGMAAIYNNEEKSDDEITNELDQM